MRWRVEWYLDAEGRPRFNVEKLRQCGPAGEHASVVWQCSGMRENDAEELAGELVRAIADACKDE